jgi:hypothetical protein
MKCSNDFNPLTALKSLGHFSSPQIPDNAQNGFQMGKFKSIISSIEYWISYRALKRPWVQSPPSLRLKFTIKKAV